MASGDLQSSGRKKPGRRKGRCAVCGERIWYEILPPPSLNGLQSPWPQIKKPVCEPGKGCRKDWGTTC